MEIRPFTSLRFSVFWPWWCVEEVQKKVTIQQLAQSHTTDCVFLYSPIPKENLGEQLQ